MTKYTIFKKNIFARCNQFEKEYKKQQKQKPVSRPLTPFARARSAEENLNTKKIEGFKPFSVASSEAGERHWFF